MIKARAELCCLLLKLPLFSLDMCNFCWSKERSHFWPSKQPLYGLFFTSKNFKVALVERLRAAFLSKKVEILNFCFLFFFSSSRPLITFFCQKCTFWIRTESTRKLFTKKYFNFLQLGDLNLVAKFDSFSFFWVFITTLSSNFKMSKC